MLFIGTGGFGGGHAGLPRVIYGVVRMKLFQFPLKSVNIFVREFPGRRSSTTPHLP